MTATTPKQEQPSKLPRIDIMTAFTQEPEPLDFVLPGMIAGTVGALIAPGGAGKSMLALQLSTQIAAQVAGGPDLLGLGEVTAGKVAYLPAEDPALVIQHRLHALGKHMGPDQQQAIAQHLVIHPLLGMRPDLCSEKWQADLMRVADGRRLVIIDTLRRFHKLEEIDSGDMAQIVGHMEVIAAKTGCAIVFLHHAAKAAVMNGSGDMQQAARGSSVLIDNARWAGFLSGMTAAEAKAHCLAVDDRHRYVRLGNCKPNYGAPTPDRWLRRNEGGILLVAEFNKQASSVTAAEAYQAGKEGDEIPDWMDGPMEAIT